MTGEQIRWLLTAVTAVCGVGLFVWFLCKRKSKSACAVLLCACLCICFLMLSDFRSVEEYGAEALPPVRDGEPWAEISIIGYEGQEILPVCKVALRDGETVMELLLRVAEAKKIPVEHAAGYVEGIGNLYEFDHGGESGWVYTVGGQKSSVSATEYSLRDGDKVLWEYVTSYTFDTEVEP